jgi:hypothetical protein
MRGSIWRWLVALTRPAPIASAEAFRSFVQERAWLIAQKCAIDYCRGKTGLASHALFTEEPFQRALAVCQHESFAAVLGDLLIIAEGQLRPHADAGQRARLCDTLQRFYADTLRDLPAPAHRPQGWGDAIAEFSERLRAASEGEPRRALDVADHSAKRLFDTLPIHLNMRELDEEPVYGSVRFRMIAVSQELQNRMAAAELAGQLAA